jgi:linalool 8-monooxygenase
LFRYWRHAEIIGNGERFVMIDLKDSQLHKSGDTQAAYAHLRANSPVYWNPEADGPGFWAVTRYDDVLAVSSDPSTFSSARANGGHRIFEENDVASDSIETSMISMDPPEHLDYRKMVMPGFVPGRLREMETGIRARGVALIETMKAKAAHNEGVIDFVADFAAPYAIQTLAELFGVSSEDGDKLFEWSNVIVAEEDPEIRPDEATVHTKVAEMFGYSMALRAQREANPGHDLISMLAQARVDGAPISVGKYLATFILIVVAGNETTRNSLTGSLLAFEDFPDARAAVFERPDIMRSCAQEIVRWVSPVHHMRRTAMRDTQIGNQAIKKGDKVVMWYASANRDEAVFSDPHVFRPDRYEDPQTARQLGFGAGQHVCLGQRLAELQIRIAWEELSARVPTLRALGKGERVLSNFINGWKTLPARI